jgi:hypothetical protein
MTLWQDIRLAVRLLAKDRHALATSGRLGDDDGGQGLAATLPAPCTAAIRWARRR